MRVSNSNHWLHRTTGLLLYEASFSVQTAAMVTFLLLFVLLLSHIPLLSHVPLQDPMTTVEMPGGPGGPRQAHAAGLCHCEAAGKLAMQVKGVSSCSASRSAPCQRLKMQHAGSTSKAP